MKSKPDRYGMKIVMLNDATTYYMFRAIPCVGKVATAENETVPYYFVRTLTEPIHGTQRVLTMDNWFTSPALFDDLKSPVWIEWCRYFKEILPPYSRKISY